MHPRMDGMDGWDGVDGVDGVGLGVGGLRQSMPASYGGWDGVDGVDVVGVSDGEAARFAKAREKKNFFARNVFDL